MKEQLKQSEKEIQVQKGLVEQCQLQKDALDKEWTAKLEKVGENAVEDFAKVMQLTEENKVLKEQIEASK